MKKFFRSAMLFAAAAMAFTSCSDDDTTEVLPVEPENQVEVNIDAHIESDTRADFAGGDGSQLTFKNGDQMQVFYTPMGIQPATWWNAIYDYDGAKFELSPREQQSQIEDGTDVTALMPTIRSGAFAIPAEQRNNWMGTYNNITSAPMAGLVTYNKATMSEGGLGEKINLAFMMRHLASYIQFNFVYDANHADNVGLDAGYAGLHVKTIEFVQTGDAAQKDIAGVIEPTSVRDLKAEIATVDFDFKAGVSQTIKVMLEAEQQPVVVNKAEKDPAKNFAYMILKPGIYTGKFVVTMQEGQVFEVPFTNMEFKRASVKRASLNLTKARCIVEGETAPTEPQLDLAMFNEVNSKNINSLIANGVKVLFLRGDYKKVSADNNYKPYVRMVDFPTTIEEVKYENQLHHKYADPSMAPLLNDLAYTLEAAEGGYRIKFTDGTYLKADGDFVVYGATQSEAVIFTFEPMATEGEVAIKAADGRYLRVEDYNKYQTAQYGAHVFVKGGKLDTDAAFSNHNYTVAEFGEGVETKEVALELDAKYDAGKHTLVAEGDANFSAQIAGTTLQITSSKNTGAAREGEVSVKLMDGARQLDEVVIAVSQAATSEVGPELIRVNAPKNLIPGATIVIMSQDKMWAMSPAGRVSMNGAFDIDGKLHMNSIPAEALMVVEGTNDACQIKNVASNTYMRANTRPVTFGAALTYSVVSDTKTDNITFLYQDGYNYYTTHNSGREYFGYEYNIANGTDLCVYQYIDPSQMPEAEISVKPASLSCAWDKTDAMTANVSIDFARADNSFVASIDNSADFDLTYDVNAMTITVTPKAQAADADKTAVVTVKLTKAGVEVAGKTATINVKQTKKPAEGGSGYVEVTSSYIPQNGDRLVFTNADKTVVASRVINANSQLSGVALKQAGMIPANYADYFEVEVDGAVFRLKDPVSGKYLRNTFMFDTKATSGWKKDAQVYQMVTGPSGDFVLKCDYAGTKYIHYTVGKYESNTGFILSQFASGAHVFVLPAK